MSKKYFFLLLILGVSMLIPGQNFSHDFEKEVFSSYKKDSLNYNFIDGLFAIDSVVNTKEILLQKQKLEKFIASLPKKEISSKKEKKRIKRIYDIVHKTFFVKYNLHSYFNDIFKDGTYNCVTSTAMYSYIFEELNIPYHIKETPSHVFLIAYPETFKIYLETTAPGAYGYAVPQESEIKNIIDELIAYKIVTTEEVNAKGYIKFYEDYYYGKEFIKKKALIGMQYYNKALGKLELLDYTSAINNFKKAQVFYSSPLIKPLLKNIMFLKINELELNTQDDIDFLVELLEISSYPKDYSISNLKASLFKVIEHDDNDAEFILTSIKKFKGIKNTKVRNEMIEFLYEYLARNSSANEDYDTAMSYVDSILTINSKSKIAKQIVEFTTFREVAFSLYNLSALNTFNKNVEKYSFLKDNKRYFISLAHFYGNLSLQNYKSNNVSDATDYRNKLEHILDNNEIIETLNKILIVDLYLRAGNYYYYKAEYQFSYIIYKKGLSYIPNHPDLLKRAQWSKDEL